MTKKLKNTIKCRNCGRSYFMNTVGFIKNIQRYCSRDDAEVDDNDGCTLGKKGDPMVGIDRFATHFVKIEDHEAVYGYHG